MYSHLSRKGYRVLRHDREISVTPYEKDIHADQVGLAEKRSKPGIPSKLTSPKTKDRHQDSPVSVGDKKNSDEQLSVETGTQKEALGTVSSVSSKDAVGTVASGSSHDSVAVAEPASLNGTDTVASGVSEAAKSLQEDLNAATNGIPNDLRTSASSNAVCNSSGQAGPCISKPDAGAQDSQRTSKPASEAQDSLSTLKPDSRAQDSPRTSKPDCSEAQDSPSTSKPDSSTLDSPSTSRPVSETQDLIARGKTLVTKVQEFITLESESSVGDNTSDSNVIVEEPEDPVEPLKIPNENDSMNIDDSSSEDAFPVPYSPDLVIVEARGQVIEIEDDASSQDEEVIITEVRKPNTDLDTVDLMDSDEDEDVVFICQKPTNSDPSKWRKRFLSTTEFVNLKFAETPEQTSKIPKVKLIDLFDLGKKSYDAIWKAIPSHDGSSRFINAPDQRFIPTTILPKFAQYRISLQQKELPPHSPNPSMRNVDTSRDLNEIVQYGREPSHFSRNEGQSFERSQNHQSGSWFDPPARPPRNQMFNQNQPNRGQQGGSSRTFHPTDPNRNQRVGSSNQNQNYNRFANRNQDRSNQWAVNPWSNNNSYNVPQTNYPTNFGPNQFGSFNNQLGGPHDGLRNAVMQAAQMQMFAMGLMQSCQALMQQFPGVMNSPNNMNFMNYMGGNLVGNLNVQQQFQNNRGHRPYRRPWRGQGRRRYYNDNRNTGSNPRVTEIPVRANEKSNVIPERVPDVTVVSDDEDKKVKPALKRNMALNAIASWNRPKKAKLKITTDVRSVKLDTSGPSDVIDLDDVSSLKSESPSSSPKLEDTKRAEKRPLAKKVALATLRSTVESLSPLATLSSAVESVNPLEHSENAAENIAEVHLDESQPSYFVYDEQVSVDSDSVGFMSETAEAEVPKGSRSESMDVAVSPGEPSLPVPSESKDEEEAESWKTFKEQEQPLGQPKGSAPLISIDNERVDISKCMFSFVYKTQF